MGSGRATEAGPTQYKVEKDGRERERERKRTGWKNSSAVHIAAADRAGWQESVEALCATWREEERRT